MSKSVEKKRIAFVVQRYGEEVVGGAEILTRAVAEKLVKEFSWEIDVFTTTAKSYVTWKNDFPTGKSVLNGVTIHRFDSIIRRSKFSGLLMRIVKWCRQLLQPFPSLRTLRQSLEWIWIFLQGPLSPSLVQAIVSKSESYDRIVYVTYLYYPTLKGLYRSQHLLSKLIVIPCAHDEATFYFDIVQNALRIPKVLLANTPGEKKLLERAGLAPEKIFIAGLGFDPDVIKPVAQKSADPYILYLGRISSGKGVHWLIDWFLEHKRLHPSSLLQLHLAGKIDDIRIPENPSIRYLGFVSDKEKVTLLQNAIALVNPSPFESLSMIVIEALAAGIPTLVNAHCEVLRYYTEQTSTSYGFLDKYSFLYELERLLKIDWGSPEARERLARSRDWALQNYAWDKVLDVYRSIALSAPPPPCTPPLTTNQI